MFKNVKKMNTFVRHTHIHIYTYIHTHTNAGQQVASKIKVFVYIINVCVLCIYILYIHNKYTQYTLGVERLLIFKVNFYVMKVGSKSTSR